MRCTCSDHYNWVKQANELNRNSNNAKNANIRIHINFRHPFTVGELQNNKVFNKKSCYNDITITAAIMKGNLWVTTNIMKMPYTGLKIYIYVYICTNARSYWYWRHNFHWYVRKIYQLEI